MNECLIYIFKSNSTQYLSIWCTWL